MSRPLWAFFHRSSFELKRAAADLTSGPPRGVNRIKWNRGLTKWQWSTRTRRFLFPVQRCGHCSSRRVRVSPASRLGSNEHQKQQPAPEYWYFHRQKGTMTRWLQFLPRSRFPRSLFISCSLFACPSREIPMSRLPMCLCSYKNLNSNDIQNK